MVKVTLETLECDVCRKPAERYTITYPDGMKVFDRCERHNKKLLGLKDEPGEWSTITAKRGRITVLTPDEIALRRNSNGE
jgi:hypothetical protein